MYQSDVGKLIGPLGGGDRFFEPDEIPTLTTDINTSHSSSPSGALQSPQMRLLVMSCILGGIVGVLFIIVQPMFGMATLTSRHAAAYQQMGAWGAFPAMLIAWFAHMAVSVFYGLICGLVMLRYKQLSIITLFTLAFTWFTTIIAPPANALIVQLVSIQQIKPDMLPPLNFALDVKFVLHLVFFVVIMAVLFIYKNRQGSSAITVGLQEANDLN